MCESVTGRRDKERKKERKTDRQTERKKKDIKRKRVSEIDILIEKDREERKK